MTISTTTHTFDYSGNGTTTIFNVPFPFKSQAHLVVTLIDNATHAVTPWVLGADYTLTGGDPTGTLTASVAPASGTTLHGERVVPVLQTLDLNANDGFPATSVEDALDLLTMMIQQGLSGGGGGSSVSLVNVGSGEGVVVDPVGGIYAIKSLKVAGTGLSIGANPDEVTVTIATMLQAANNLSDVAARQTALNNLTAVGAATNEYVLTKDTGTGNAIWKVVPTGGGGEANTSSNAGGTVGLALAKAGVNLPFRGLTAGANVTLTPSGTDVTIAASGEANTISSAAAAGLTLVNGKVGVDLRIKGLAVTSPLSLSANATDVTAALDLTATIGWTGKHTITRSAVADSANLSVYSNNNGSIATADNLLSSGYLPVVDIRKTSDAAAYTTAMDDGGVFGLYVQHDVSGVGTYAGPFAEMLHGGIRSQVRTNNVTGAAGGITAFYGGTKNNGSQAAVAWGYFVDVYHNNSNAGSASYGFSAEIYRDNAGGRCDGFVAKNMVRAGLTADTAFLVRRDASAPAWDIGFGIGASSLAGNVNVGFDATFGTIATAAFRMASGHLFRLSGTTNAADVRYNTTSAAFGGSDLAIEFLNAGNTTFAVRTDGVPAFRGTTLTNVGASGSGVAALPALPVAYLPVWIKNPVGGAPLVAKIPCYNF